MKAGIVIVVVLLLAGGYFWSEHSTKAPATNDVTAGQEEQNTNQQAVDTTGGVSGRDSSDESLSQDSTTLDAEMSAYASDSSSADGSINDKQVVN